MFLIPSVPKGLWIDRFAMRLGRLAPGLSPQTATDHAVHSFDEAADLEPEEAAEIFALELPPADAGCPGS